MIKFLQQFNQAVFMLQFSIIIQHDGRNEGYATDYLHWVASYVEEGDYEVIDEEEAKTS